MSWIPLHTEEELEVLHQSSFRQPVLLYKHSTRCSISSMALGRLERSGISSQISAYYLDLIRFRSISDSIAEKYHVRHESPQILLLYKGECLLDASHMDIDPAEIMQEATGTQGQTTP